MFTPGEYRKKASGYGELVKSATSPNQRREFQSLERSFTELADNEQWLSDNHGKIVHAAEHERLGGVTLAKEEEHILRCLGAAPILQWNTLPKKLQRELSGKMIQAAARAGTDTALYTAAIARWDNEGGASPGASKTPEAREGRSPGGLRRPQ